MSVKFYSGTYAPLRPRFASSDSTSSVETGVLTQEQQLRADRVALELISMICPEWTLLSQGVEQFDRRAIQECKTIDKFGGLYSVSGDSPAEKEYIALSAVDPMRSLRKELGDATFADLAEKGLFRGTPQRARIVTFEAHPLVALAALHTHGDIGAANASSFRLSDNFIHTYPHFSRLITESPEVVRPILTNTVSKIKRMNEPSLLRQPLLRVVELLASGKSTLIDQMNYLERRRDP